MGSGSSKKQRNSSAPKENANNTPGNTTPAGPLARQPVPETAASGTGQQNSAAENPPGAGGGERGGGEKRGGGRSVQAYKHMMTATRRLQQDLREAHQRRDRPRTSRGKFRGHRQEGKDDESTDVVFLLLAGDVTLECPPSDKIVRIFLSSTFTDTKHERNSLMERVYPRLKEWCQERGYQFQVVDMRWGVRDEATDDHRTTDLCLREIDLCKKLSTGPCFVTLLSHKYGYRSFPNMFEVSEFQKILDAVTSDHAKELLTKWFKKDDNAVPSTYILQPISSQLPDFFSNEEASRSKAASQWWEESEVMQELIGEAAVTCLSKERAHAIMQSVTEVEIRRGLLGEPSLLQRGLWFYRHIQDIDEVKPSKSRSKFKDGRGSEAKQAESKVMLEDLKKELSAAFPPDRLYRYDVGWNKDAGIDPVKDSKHRDYINNFCRDFEQQLQHWTEEAISARDQDTRVNPLVEEVTQHTRFCQEKCRSFYGRQDALKLASDYLKSKHSGDVFVIHGKSGSGKTSIVAMAAREACKVHSGKGAVILRFLGTTPDSTTVGSLLSSIIHQLTAVKSRSIVQEELPTSIKELGKMFQKMLKEGSSEQFPVTLLLDSLDQLDPSNSARQLTWLPTNLPNHVKVIVSTLPEAQYEAFPKLQAIYKGKESNFYGVPTLEDKDVSGILDQWLAASKRRLTANQRQVVLDAFKECPLPIFLKLSFDAACKWRSYFTPADTVLQTTVRDSINMMFAGLEKMHGQMLVSRALGYLTISQSGLTETELEDILSCDDDVLKDVYTYWTPPVRRLPPLLLVRLKADLGQYLVERGADGVGVFFWYHRQFIEAAHDRYCGDEMTRTTLHTALAHFFCGTWAEARAKPYTDKAGKAAKADRIVSPQPLKFGDSFNLRKLNNLPYHAVEARDKDLLKKECLLNFSFLQSKLIACGVRAVLDDFRTARKVFDEDEDVKTVAEALQLSQDGLQYDPHQLPAQMICRINSAPKGVQAFLQQCKGSDEIFLLPNQQLLVPPGGQLVHSLNLHTADVTGLAMTADGKFVVTCSSDRSLCIVDVKEGRMVRKMEGVGEDLEQVYLCCDDSVIVTVCDTAVIAYTFDTAVPVWKLEITITPQVCFCSQGRSTMVVFDEEGVILYDAKTGIEKDQIAKPKSLQHLDFDSSSYTAGSERYAVSTDTDQEWVVVLDVKEKQFLAHRHMKRDLQVFGASEDDDDDAQFMVEGLAVSHDGKHVICANTSDNNLHFLDIHSLKVVKILQGSSSDYSEKFHVMADGQSLYFPNRRAIRVWDLKHNRMASALLHVNFVTDVATVDMRTVVTIADDRLIRIWDLGRGLPEGQTTSLEYRDVKVWTPGKEMETSSKNSDGKENGEEKGKDDGKKDEDDQADNGSKMKIKKMVLLSSPRYMLLVSQSGDQQFLRVYDVAKELCVREASLGAIQPHSIHHVQGTLVMACVDQRLKLIDVNKMVVVRSFQGRLYKSSKDCTHLINNGKEVLTLTRGGNHLKVYSIATGKVVAVMKQTSPTLMNFEKVCVNEGSTVAVTELSSNDRFLVFDLKHRQHTHSIEAEDLKTSYPSLIEAAITADGHFLVCTGDVELKDDVTEEEESETAMLVYDLEKREFARYLMDEQMFWQYKRNSECRLDTYCNALKLLDNERVLSSHDDFFLRIFIIHTGELVLRIEGHLCSPDLYLQPSCPLLLTHGTYSEENAFRVWAKRDFTPLASFSMDDELNSFMLLGNHCTQFLADTSKYADPVVFHMHGSSKNALLGNQKPLTSLPELYKGKKLSLTIAHLDKDEGVDDANDPDDDEEVAITDSDEDPDDDEEVEIAPSDEDIRDSGDGQNDQKGNDGNDNINC